MHKPFLRNISAVLVVSFMLQDISWAASEIVSQALDHSPKKIELSSEFSKITGEYVGEQAKRIIHIQDAHTNLSAQRNLAKVIEELVTRHKIQTVFVEGGTRDDSLTFLRPLADKKTRERVANQYMIRGEMAGEEYLSLASDLDFKILGVEDIALYKKNLEYYRSIAHSREKIFNYLHEIEKRSDTLKRQLYPEAMLKLDERIAQFEKKDADFSGYFDALLDEAKKAGVNVLDYPQFLSLGKLKEQESQIDFQKANQEQAALFQAIQKADPEHARELQKTAGKTQKLRYGSRELGAFYDKLLKEAAKYTVSTEELKKYSDYLGYYGRLHFEELLSEIAALEKEIFERSLGTGKAFALYEYSAYLKKLRTLFSLQATREDVDTYLEARNDTRFRTVSVIAFLNRALYDLNREAEVLPYDAIIEDNLKTVEGFYAATRERDEVFVKKALEQMESQKLTSAALITGGYHTGNLNKLFQERGISYTVVTPHVLEETNMKRYEKLLLSQFGGSSLMGAGATPALNFQRMKSYMKMGSFAGRSEAVEGARLSLLGSAPAHRSAGARLASSPRTNGLVLRNVDTVRGARLADMKQKLYQEAEVLNTLSAISGLIPEAIKWDWLDEFSGDMTRIPAQDIAEISKFKTELSQFYKILSLIRDGHIKVTDPTKKYLAQLYYQVLTGTIHNQRLTQSVRLGALIALYALVPMIDAHDVLQTLKDFMTSNQRGDTKLSHRVLKVLELLLSIAFLPVADYLVDVMDGHSNHGVRGAAEGIVTSFLQKTWLSSEGNLGPIISDSVRFEDHSSQTDRLKSMIKDGRLKADDKIVVTYLDRSSGSWQLVTKPATFVKKPHMWSGDAVEVSIDGSERPFRLMIGETSMWRLVSLVKSGADNTPTTISTILDQLKKLEGKTDQLISATYRRKDPAGKIPDSNLTEIGKLVSVWYGDYDGGVEIQVGDKKLKFSTSSPVMPLIEVKIVAGGARLAATASPRVKGRGEWGEGVQARFRTRPLTSDALRPSGARLAANEPVLSMLNITHWHWKWDNFVLGAHASYSGDNLITMGNWLNHIDEHPNWWFTYRDHKDAEHLRKGFFISYVPDKDEFTVETSSGSLRLTTKPGTLSEQRSGQILSLRLTDKQIPQVARGVGAQPEPTDGALLSNSNSSNLHFERRKFLQVLGAGAAATAVGAVFPLNQVAAIVAPTFPPNAKAVSSVLVAVLENQMQPAMWTRVIHFEDVFGLNLRIPGFHSDGASAVNRHNLAIFGEVMPDILDDLRERIRNFAYKLWDRPWPEAGSELMAIYREAQSTKEAILSLSPTTAEALREGNLTHLRQDLVKKLHEARSELDRMQATAEKVESKLWGLRSQGMVSVRDSEREILKRYYLLQDNARAVENEIYVLDHLAKARGRSQLQSDQGARLAGEPGVSVQRTGVTLGARLAKENVTADEDSTRTGSMVLAATAGAAIGFLAGVLASQWVVSARQERDKRAEALLLSTQRYAEGWKLNGSTVEIAIASYETEEDKERLLDQIERVQRNSGASEKLFQSRENILSLIDNKQVVIATGEVKGKRIIAGAVFTNSSYFGRIRKYAQIANRVMHLLHGDTLYDFWIIVDTEASEVDKIKISSALIDHSLEIAIKAGKNIVAYSRAGDTWKNLSSEERATVTDTKSKIDAPSVGVVNRLKRKLPNRRLPKQFDAYVGKLLVRHVITTRLASRRDDPKSPMPFVEWLETNNYPKHLIDKVRQTLEPKLSDDKWGQWNPTTDKRFVSIVGLLLMLYQLSFDKPTEERITGDLALGGLHMRRKLAFMTAIYLNSRPEDDDGLFANVMMDYRFAVMADEAERRQAVSAEVQKLIRKDRYGMRTAAARLAGAPGDSAQGTAVMHGSLSAEAKDRFQEAMDEGQAVRVAYRVDLPTERMRRSDDRPRTYTGVITDIGLTGFKMSHSQMLNMRKRPPDINASMAADVDVDLNSIISSSVFDGDKWVVISGDPDTEGARMSEASILDEATIVRFTNWAQRVLGSKRYPDEVIPEIIQTVWVQALPKVYGNNGLTLSWPLLAGTLQHAGVDWMRKLFGRDPLTRRTFVSWDYDQDDRPVEVERGLIEGITQDQVRSAVAQLTDKRLRQVILMRIAKKEWKFAEIAKELGITEGRAKQLEQSAIKKIRKILKIAEPPRRSPLTSRSGADSTSTYMRTILSEIRRVRDDHRVLDRLSRSDVYYLESRADKPFLEHVVRITVNELVDKFDSGHIPAFSAREHDDIVKAVQEAVQKKVILGSKDPFVKLAMRVKPRTRAGYPSIGLSDAKLRSLVRRYGKQLQKVGWSADHGAEATGGARLSDKSDGPNSSSEDDTLLVYKIPTLSEEQIGQIIQFAGKNWDAHAVEDAANETVLSMLDQTIAEMIREEDILRNLTFNDVHRQPNFIKTHSVMEDFVLMRLQWTGKAIPVDEYKQYFLASIFDDLLAYDLDSKEFDQLFDAIVDVANYHADIRDTLMDITYNAYSAHYLYEDIVGFLDDYESPSVIKRVIGVYARELLIRLDVPIDAGARLARQWTDAEGNISRKTYPKGHFFYQKVKYSTSVQYKHKTVVLKERAGSSQILDVYYNREKIGRIHLDEKIFIFDEEVRFADEDGAFKWKGIRYPLGKAYQEKLVSIKPTSYVDPRTRRAVFIDGKKIAEISAGVSGVALVDPWQERQVDRGRIKFEGRRWSLPSSFRKETSVFVRPITNDDSPFEVRRSSEGQTLSAGARLSASVAGKMLEINVKAYKQIKAIAGSASVTDHLITKPYISGSPRLQGSPFTISPDHVQSSLGQTHALLYWRPRTADAYQGRWLKADQVSQLLDDLNGPNPELVAYLQDQWKLGDANTAESVPTVKVVSKLDWEDMSPGQKVQEYLRAKYGWKNVYIASPEVFGDEAAKVMTHKVRSMQQAAKGRILNAALATANTMKPIYDSLVRDAALDEAIRWGRIRASQIDEFHGLSIRDPRTWNAYLNENLYDALPDNNSIDEDNIHRILEYTQKYGWRGMGEYRKALKTAGRIDFIMLGLGPDGHMAFIAPGTAMDDDTTDKVTLTPEAAQANGMPIGQKAFTLTMQEVLSARHIFFFVNGSHKAGILAKVFEGHFNKKYPASALTQKKSEEISVVFDTEAIGELVGMADSWHRDNEMRRYELENKGRTTLHERSGARLASTAAVSLDEAIQRYLDAVVGSIRSLIAEKKGLEKIPTLKALYVPRYQADQEIVLDYFEGRKLIKHLLDNVFSPDTVLGVDLNQDSRLVVGMDGSLTVQPLVSDAASPASKANIVINAMKPFVTKHRVVTVSAGNDLESGLKPELLRVMQSAIQNHPSNTRIKLYPGDKNPIEYSVETLKTSSEIDQMWRRLVSRLKRHYPAQFMNAQYQLSWTEELNGRLRLDVRVVGARLSTSAENPLEAQEDIIGSLRQRLSDLKKDKASLDELLIQAKDRRIQVIRSLREANENKARVLESRDREKIASTATIVTRLDGELTDGDALIKKTSETIGGLSTEIEQVTQDIEAALAELKRMQIAADPELSSEQRDREQAVENTKALLEHGSQDATLEVKRALTKAIQNGSTPQSVAPIVSMVLVLLRQHLKADDPIANLATATNVKLSPDKLDAIYNELAALNPDAIIQSIPVSSDPVLDELATAPSISSPARTSARSGAARKRSTTKVQAPKRPNFSDRWQLSSGHIVSLANDPPGSGTANSKSLMLSPDQVAELIAGTDPNAFQIHIAANRASQHDLSIYSASSAPSSGNGAEAIFSLLLISDERLDRETQESGRSSVSVYLSPSDFTNISLPYREWLEERLVPLLQSLGFETIVLVDTSHPVRSRLTPTVIDISEIPPVKEISTVTKFPSDAEQLFKRLGDGESIPSLMAMIGPGLLDQRRLVVLAVISMLHSDPIVRENAMLMIKQFILVSKAHTIRHLFNRTLHLLAGDWVEEGGVMKFFHELHGDAPVLDANERKAIGLKLLITILDESTLDVKRSIFHYLDEFIPNSDFSKLPDNRALTDDLKKYTIQLLAIWPPRLDLKTSTHPAAVMSAPSSGEVEVRPGARLSENPLEGMEKWLRENRSVTVKFSELREAVYGQVMIAAAAASEGDQIRYFYNSPRLTSDQRIALARVQSHIVPAGIFINNWTRIQNYIQAQEEERYESLLYRVYSIDNNIIIMSADYDPEQSSTPQAPPSETQPMRSDKHSPVLSGARLAEVTKAKFNLKPSVPTNISIADFRDRPLRGEPRRLDLSRDPDDNASLGGAISSFKPGARLATKLDKEVFYNAQVGINASIKVNGGQYTFQVLGINDLTQALKVKARSSDGRTLMKVSYGKPIPVDTRKPFYLNVGEQLLIADLSIKPSEIGEAQATLSLYPKKDLRIDAFDANNQPIVVERAADRRQESVAGGSAQNVGSRFSMVRLVPGRVYQAQVEKDGSIGFNGRHYRFKVLAINTTTDHIKLEPQIPPSAWLTKLRSGQSDLDNISRTEPFYLNKNEQVHIHGALWIELVGFKKGKALINIMTHLDMNVTIRDGQGKFVKDQPTPIVIQDDLESEVTASEPRDGGARLAVDQRPGGRTQETDKKLSTDHSPQTTASSLPSTIDHRLLTEVGSRLAEDQATVSHGTLSQEERTEDDFPRVGELLNQNVPLFQDATDQVKGEMIEAVLENQMHLVEKYYYLLKFIAQNLALAPFDLTMDDFIQQARISIWGSLDRFSRDGYSQPYPMSQRFQNDLYSDSLALFAETYKVSWLDTSRFVGHLRRWITDRSPGELKVNTGDLIKALTKDGDDAAFLEKVTNTSRETVSLTPRLEEILASDLRSHPDHDHFLNDLMYRLQKLDKPHSRRASGRMMSVIALRFGLFGEDEHTLEKIGLIFGRITRERVRQIERKAISKLRSQGGEISKIYRGTHINEHLDYVPEDVPPRNASSRRSLNKERLKAFLDEQLSYSGRLYLQHWPDPEPAEALTLHRYTGRSKVQPLARATTAKLRFLLTIGALAQFGPQDQVVDYIFGEYAQEQSRGARLAGDQDTTSNVAKSQANPEVGGRSPEATDSEGARMARSGVSGQASADSVRTMGARLAKKGSNSTHSSNMVVTITEDAIFAQQAATAIADEIVKVQARTEVDLHKNHEPKTANVVFAYGKTQIPVLARLIEDERIDWARVRIFHGDELMGLDKSNPGSAAHFFEEHLVGPLRKKGYIFKEGVNLFYMDTKQASPNPIEYERTLNSFGGAHVMILGLGLNGHIYFNEPGTPFSMSAHIAALSATSLEYNLAATDPRAMTLGPKNVERADKAFMLISGSTKQRPTQQFLNGPVNQAVPATFLRTLPRNKVKVFIDKSAYDAQLAGDQATTKSQENPEVGGPISEIRSQHSDEINIIGSRLAATKNRSFFGAKIPMLVQSLVLMFALSGTAQAATVTAEQIEDFGAARGLVIWQGPISNLDSNSIATIPAASASASIQEAVVKENMDYNSAVAGLPDGISSIVIASDLEVSYGQFANLDTLVLSLEQMESIQRKVFSKSPTRVFVTGTENLDTTTLSALQSAITPFSFVTLGPAPRDRVTVKIINTDDEDAAFIKDTAIPIPAESENGNSLLGRPLWVIAKAMALMLAKDGQWTGDASVDDISNSAALTYSSGSAQVTPNTTLHTLVTYIADKPTFVRHRILPSLKAIDTNILRVIANLKRQLTTFA